MMRWKANAPETLGAAERPTSQAVRFRKKTKHQENLKKKPLKTLKIEQVAFNS